MITADLHSHTRYSHGASTPQEMYAAACTAGLKLLGFTEHSPRPLGFDYTNEYREQLSRFMPTYAREVCELRDNAAPDACQVLFGMEMDWLEGQADFARQACTAYDFDYLLGSVHFIGHWGFDDQASDWDILSQEECERNYVRYFQSWREMIASGMFQIAAHPDLIKIFSVDDFHRWLELPASMDLVGDALTAVRDAGMAMEISSAGLRKSCREIYPGPKILHLARNLGLPITFASDSHATDQVAWNFDTLARYAASEGWTESLVFCRGHVTTMPFSAGPLLRPVRK